MLGGEKCRKSRKEDSKKEATIDQINQSNFDITCINMIGWSYMSHVVCDYIEGGVIVLGIENCVTVTIILMWLYRSKSNIKLIGKWKNVTISQMWLYREWL